MNIKFELFNHFKKPFSQGDIKIKKWQKALTIGLSTPLFIFLFIPGLLTLYGLSGYFKYRQIKQVNDPSSPVSRLAQQTLDPQSSHREPSEAATAASSESTDNEEGSNLEKPIKLQDLPEELIARVLSFVEDPTVRLVNRDWERLHKVVAPCPALLIPLQKGEIPSITHPITKYFNNFDELTKSLGTHWLEEILLTKQSLTQQEEEFVLNNIWLSSFNFDNLSNIEKKFPLISQPLARLMNGENYNPESDLQQRLFFRDINERRSDNFTVDIKILEGIIKLRLIQYDDSTGTGLVEVLNLIRLKKFITITVKGEELGSYRLLAAFLKADGMLLRHIPKPLDSYALTWDDQSYSPLEDDFFDLISRPTSKDYGRLPKNKALDLYLTAVQQEGFALEFVPTKYRTKEICQAAVLQKKTKDERTEVLKYVPKKLQKKMKKLLTPD